MDFSEEEEKEVHDSEGDSQSMSLSILIENVVNYENPNEGWDLIRTWLSEHSIDEAKSAIELKEDFDTTALHVACRSMPPTDVVDIMVAAAPDMVFWADSFGWLPLHYACANGANIDVLKLLIDDFPDSIITMDKRGRTPLHFALGNAEVPVTVPMVKLLAGKSSDGLRWPDENGMLPIHYACAYGAPVEVLHVLIESWEESMMKKDSKGRNVLHFAMANSDRANSPAIIQLLLELDELKDLDIPDDDKNIPLRLLCTKAMSIDESDTDARDNTQNCFEIYLDSKPKISSEFLIGIKLLPQWLRDIAVIHPSVQSMINAKISSRFPTMVLILDVYFLAAVIGTFSVTSLQSIERRFNPSNITQESRSVSAALLSPLYIGALYFLIREMTQMISTKSQTTITSYLLDPENVLNMAYVFLIIYNSILMQTGLGNDEQFQIGATLTLGVCWSQVLSYFKSLFIEFAVFVSGVLFVLPRLSPFMICLLITVLAFSQMWHTIFQQSDLCYSYGGPNYSEMDVGYENATNVTNDLSIGSDYDDTYYYDMSIATLTESIADCEPALDDPFCRSMRWTVYETYTMMITGLHSDIEGQSTLSFLVGNAFRFLVVMLLLQILIAIICDLYGVIINDRAVIVFWSNRLIFVTDMDIVTNGPWKETVRNFFRIKDDYEDDESSTDSLDHRKKKKPVTWEDILWRKFLDYFNPDSEGTRIRDNFMYFPLSIFISTFLLPLWLLLGILSAGWIWPPQVRKGLFTQRESVPEDSAEVQVEEQCMEAILTVRNNLALVQEDLVCTLQNDRKNLVSLHGQVREVKEELKNEVKNIKKVMTSLYELELQQQIVTVSSS